VAIAEERGRVQGLADLATTSLVALASLTAGVLHSQFGWDVLILAGCVPVFILGCCLGWLGFCSRHSSVRAP
jgi:ribose/xylose/arabinose/galactoside ABC-type transport system permease subunit